MTRPPTTAAARRPIVNHRIFSAYGQMLSQTNPTTLDPAAVDCLFAFTGRALDRATGLQNNLNRWYDPTAGRWMSEDPDGLGPDVNQYRYCDNSPTRGIDSSGLATVFWTNEVKVWGTSGAWGAYTTSSTLPSPT